MATGPNGDPAVSALESRVAQMDERLGRVEEGQDGLRDELREMRGDMHTMDTEIRRDILRWSVALFVGISAVVALLKFLP